MSVRTGRHRESISFFSDPEQDFGFSYQYVIDRVSDKELGADARGDSPNWAQLIPPVLSLFTR